MTPTDPPRRLRRRLLRALGLLVLTLLAGSVAVVAILRFVPPPTSAFMLRAALARDAAAVSYRWVPREAISPHLGIALVAAEDQKFLAHHGFDIDAIGLAWEGGQRRGASTISQQVAKNLFLWPGRSWVRKGLEAYFTVLIEAMWPKRRILEVYMNIAQFGPQTFGAEAASRRYFSKPAAALGRREAALLAAVLPNPVVLRVDRPSPYVMRRVAWIERQARQLGGPGYLKEM